MNKENTSFGQISSEDLEIGDIVEWTKWNSEDEIWEPYYGVLVNLKNEMRSNRLVSISTVMPLHENASELEFFTFSLKLVSRSKEEIM